MPRNDWLMQQQLLRHLAHLEALVDARHVTRAAERMGIGQPAMSGSLAKLRALFQDPLLIRTREGMAPTPRALELAARARQLRELLDGFDAPTAPFDAAISQAQFRIIAADGVASLVAPGLAQRAGREAPGVRIAIYPGDPRRAQEVLREGDVDLMLAYIRKPPAGLRHTALYSQPLVCIARNNHPSVVGSLTLQQFLRERHVVWGAPSMPTATMEMMVTEALGRGGHARQVSLQVSSTLLLPEVVASSDLLAVVPERLALRTRHSHLLQVIPVPFRLDPIAVWMLWHDRLHNDPAHRWLRAVVSAVGRAARVG